MHKYFVYLSLAFLLYALYSADYLIVPAVHEPGLLAASFILLFLGFLADAASWHWMLRLQGFSVSGRQSLASTGLAIFGKYIPGKFWIIVGRSVYLREKLSGAMGRLTLISLQTQLLALLMGMALGVIPLFWLALPVYWGGMLLMVGGGIGALLFSSHLNRTVAALLRTFGMSVKFSALGFGLALRASPCFFLSWCCWGLSFALLVSALGGGAFSLLVGLAFPLAATLGILVVIAPGGMGVREGVLTGILLALGFATADATSIAVFSRLWFLVGEGFIFVVALGCDRGGVKVPANDVEQGR